MIALIRPRRRPTATTRPACTHPDGARTSRPAGLSRTWVQTCPCGQQWTVTP